MNRKVLNWKPERKQSITLKNKAKPGIVIKKYDEDTGMPLPNAEFSVAKKVEASFMKA